MVVSKTKVLIIEGNAGLRYELKRVFAQRGHSVTLFSRAAKGLEKMRSGYYDLVIARIGEEPAGLSLLAEGKKLLPDSIFIIMAGQVTSVGAVKTLRAGAADLLLEPFTAEEVAHAADIALAPRKDQITARKMYCCLEKEERVFVFPSEESSIGPAVDLLVENLARAGVCSQLESRLVAIALTEAVANAIYHGNLAISPHKKVEMSGDEFKKEVRKRLKNPAYRGRKVRVKYVLSPEGVKYVISDDGDGFNTSEWLLPENESTRHTSGGRGLMLLRRLMDEVYYNDKGNEVTLVKRMGKK
ncbi:MAG: ATP-binding protein [Nitrospinae bacterium]|nr:ATP-binding protein [Nitrospinota bacterium]